VKKILDNKRAQVGETLTWIIASIIILVVLVVFIYASVGLAKTKNITTRDIGSDELGAGNGDWINMKTSLAFSLNNKNKNIIERWINAEE
jgi:hypothetical protein